MCLSSVSGYRPLYKPTPVPRKSSFRYNSMFNFIPVSFSFLFVIFRVRVTGRDAILSVTGLPVRVSYRVRVRVRVRVRDR